MVELEHSESLEETLQDLKEDAELIRIVLLGAQGSTDALTLRCILRLSDYLTQHGDDLNMLLKK